MNLHDLGLLALAVLSVFGPGIVLLKAGLRRGWLESLAAAPAVSVTLCYLAALAAELLGVSWGPVAVVAVTAVATAAAWLIRRRWAGTAAAAGGWRVSLPRDLWLPVGGVIMSSAVGLWTFKRGFGHLSVLPQEHDMVLQTLLVARIARTGQAAPGQSSPVDLLTGNPAGFYPNGLHMLAALAAPNAGLSVAALNAVTVVLFALVLPIGMAALARLVTPPSIRPVAMSVAALISVGAYRPVFAFLHDGGVLANAAALALAPGVVYAAITAVTDRRLGTTVTAAVAFVGAVVVHPTAAPLIAITAGAWILGTLVVSADGVKDAVQKVARLAVAAAVAVVILGPFLIKAAATAGFVTAFPRGTPPTSLGGALGTTLSFYYGGYYNPGLGISQTVFAMTSLLGVALCLHYRANLALLVTYGVWWAILMLWLVRPTFPLVSTLGGIYYNSYGRFSGGLTIIQWLTAAVAIGLLVDVLGRCVRRLGLQSRLSRIGLTEVRLPVLAGTVAVLLFLLVTVNYATVNSLTVQQRYAAPEFERVGHDDLAAGRFLAAHVKPGQRVMNNANDGSTYDYVFYGVPIVETSTLGSPYALYTTELLMRFDDLETDPEVRGLVCRLNIAWVVADAGAPTIGAQSSVTPLGTHGIYSTPPGFADLSSVTTLHRAYSSGPDTVYAVDLHALGCPA